MLQIGKTLLKKSESLLCNLLKQSKDHLKIRAGIGKQNEPSSADNTSNTIGADLIVWNWTSYCYTNYKCLCVTYTSRILFDPTFTLIELPMLWPTTWVQGTLAKRAGNMACWPASSAGSGARGPWHWRVFDQILKRNKSLQNVWKQEAKALVCHIFYHFVNQSSTQGKPSSISSQDYKPWPSLLTSSCPTSKSNYYLEPDNKVTPGACLSSCLSFPGTPNPQQVSAECQGLATLLENSNGPQLHWVWWTNP